jgi:hypothetical protein
MGRNSETLRFYKGQDAAFPEIQGINALGVVAIVPSLIERGRQLREKGVRCRTSEDL